MHIVEKDEHLDYYTFMNYGLPDDAGHGEYTKALGNRVWDLLHGIADNYGCHACKADAQTLISTIHDIVNVKLGKGVYDPARFEAGVRMINKLYQEWLSSGKPIHEESSSSEIQRSHLKQLNFSGLTH
jgi:hypothetical protein